MQENRSFDHYFGSLHGVRGFGDKLAIPIQGNQLVWNQKDANAKIIPPYHLNTQLTSAQRVPSSPHTMPDAHSAWAGGKMSEWPKYKTQFSMGYYRQYQGRYDLWVLGPNGFHRHFQGHAHSECKVETHIHYAAASGEIYLQLHNTGKKEASLTIHANDYRNDGPWQLKIAAGQTVVHEWSLFESYHWYDFSVSDNHGFVRRFTGRVETGQDSISDPSNAGTTTKPRKKFSR